MTFFLIISNSQRSLEQILSSIIRVRREIEMVIDGIEATREKVEELDQIFGLYYLENSMRELANAVDSIPTVYDLKQKYGNGM